MRHAALALLLVAAHGSCAASSDAPAGSFTAQQCARLAVLRDGAVFRDYEYSSRVLQSAREAQALLKAVLEETRLAERSARRLGAGKNALLAVQALDTLLGAVVPTKQVLDTFERSTGLLLTYAGTEIAKRAVETPELASDIGKATNALDVWLAFGSLVPVVGDAAEALRKFIDIAESTRETSEDVSSLRSSLRNLEKQLAQATARLQQAERRQSLALRVKNEIDARCGSNKQRKNDQARPKTPSWLDFAPSQEAETRTTRSSGDCGVLDSKESSDIAIHEPERFEQLLATCRGRRGIGTPVDVGSPATKPTPQPPPVDFNAAQPGGEPYTFKPFAVEKPKGYAVDPAVGRVRPSSSTPATQRSGGNSGPLTCRSGGCAQR